MTTYAFKQVTCSICGASSEQKVLCSTNCFGSPDLDLRPPEMERSTMSAWLQECPTCGFVSKDLREAEDGAKEVMLDDRIASLHQGGSAGALIRRFLKRSLLDEELGNEEAAAEHALWAAWAADDAQDQAAAEYRARAATLFLAAASNLPASSRESIEMRTRTVDILRRAGKWQEAVDLADTILQQPDLDPTLRSVVAFGRKLARDQVGSSLTVRHALAV